MVDSDTGSNLRKLIKTHLEQNNLTVDTAQGSGGGPASRRNSINKSAAGVLG